MSVQRIYKYNIIKHICVYYMHVHIPFYHAIDLKNLWKKNDVEG